MTPWFFTLAQVSILAYALLGGVFLAFSDFIMRSLARTGGSGGIEAMQVVNREVFRWIFMALFLGMAPVSLLLSGYGYLALGGPGAMPVVLSGLVYLVGCFAVTVRFNVPMNEALAAMDPTADIARSYWEGTYLPRWTFWNSVRTAACIAAAGLLLAGILRIGPGG